LDIWQEQLPEFDAEAINAKYKGISGESMTPVETATCEKIRELASRPVRSTFAKRHRSFFRYPLSSAPDWRQPPSTHHLATGTAGASIDLSATLRVKTEIRKSRRSQAVSAGLRLQSAASQ
jgi:hypothetical protein